VFCNRQAGLDDFVAAIATHRHFAGETDPPTRLTRRGCGVN